MNDPKRILVVFLSLIVLGGLCFGIKGYMDGDGYKKEVNYNTAVQATEKDKFNYIVDSQQGRVLASGTFNFDPAKSVKFDEMNKAFPYVKRVEEHYTMHTQEICTSNGEGGENCTTETYYTWDETDSQTIKSPTISFMDREYPTELFNINPYVSGTDACSFTAAGSGTGFFESKKGCIDGDYYLDDDNRYVYSVAPQSFHATFLATTYGGLKPFQEDKITLVNKDIPQVLRDAGQYKLYSFWTFITILVILTGFAIWLGYEWVMEDGEWSTLD